MLYEVSQIRFLRLAILVAFCAQRNAPPTPVKNATKARGIKTKTKHTRKRYEWESIVADGQPTKMFRLIFQPS